jgi:hypothetical protein
VVFDLEKIEMNIELSLYYILYGDRDMKDKPNTRHLQKSVFGIEDPAEILSGRLK